jgi:hypothetical protein
MKKKLFVAECEIEVPSYKCVVKYCCANCCHDPCCHDPCCDGGCCNAGYYDAGCYGPAYGGAIEAEDEASPAPEAQAFGVAPLPRF